MNTTTTKPAEQTLQRQPDPRRQAIGKLHGPRLPYHPIIKESFGIDVGTWKALCESLYPMAKTTDSVCLALAYCKARNLDIMKKPVHIVPMWNSELNREVETVWPAITEHRITAHRTGLYAGADPTSFGPTLTEKFEAKIKKGKNTGKIISAEVTFPEWAEITVYRMVLGARVPFPGPRVYFKEFYGMMAGLPVPNARWQRSPFQMTEKCAEAGALRKAFSEELGSEPVAEEMEGRIMQQVLNAMNAPGRPQPKAETAGAAFPNESEIIDVTATSAEDADPPFDEDTGEIVEERKGDEQKGEPEKKDPPKEAARDRIAEHVASSVEESKTLDESTLMQADENLRAILKTENREELIPQWVTAYDARMAIIKGPPPKGEEKKTAKPANKDLDYEDYKKEQYAALAAATQMGTVDDLQDAVTPNLREEDKAGWVAACNVKAKALLAPKAKK